MALIVAALMALELYAGSVRFSEAGDSLSQSVQIQATVRNPNTVSWANGDVIDDDNDNTARFTIQSESGSENILSILLPSGKGSWWNIVLEKTQATQRSLASDLSTTSHIGTYEVYSLQAQPPVRVNLDDSERLVITLSPL